MNAVDQNTSSKQEVAIVSTHSRLKAAGSTIQPLVPRLKSFNTQPPEGGWFDVLLGITNLQVSTHSRPKAAARRQAWRTVSLRFQHTAARRRLYCACRPHTLFGCFNTQPPEGGCSFCRLLNRFVVFQHTAARRRLLRKPCKSGLSGWFQHTAARRRLHTDL